MPFVLRRRKADVLSQLVGKVEHESHLKMTARQQRVYDEQLAEETKEVMQSWEKGWDDVINKGKDEKASRKGFGKARQGLRRSDEEASTKIFNNELKEELRKVMAEALKQGFLMGFREGFDAGFAKGFEADEYTYGKGSNKGFERGFDKGSSLGYEEGKTERGFNNFARASTRASEREGRKGFDKGTQKTQPRSLGSND